MEANMPLLDTARMKNVEALTAVFDRYAPSIYNYAFRLCHDPLIADQVVGGVFANLAEDLSSRRAIIISLRPYLYGIAYQLVLNEARYPYRSTPNKAADLLPAVEYPADVSAEKSVSLGAIMSAITNDLTEPQCHVVILRFLEGFSLKETAAIMGKTVNNVKVIQNRACAALRKVLVYPTDEISVKLKSFNYLESLKEKYPPELLATRRGATIIPVLTGVEQDLRLAYR
jgi:RNA polymerase sigma-70 factor (ECF subfamily)